MNIYHITCSPQLGIVHLHFWGCNLSCRGCLLKKELYDCHLAETRRRILLRTDESPRAPERFLDLDEVMRVLGTLKVKQVVFMGAEPATDRQLPELAGALHREFGSRNTLLTNGLKLADLEHIDEVVFSIKAFSDELHRDYTGRSNKKALGNFVRYYKSGVKLRAESVYIPGYIGSSEIEAISRFIASVDKNIAYRVDAYIPIGDNPWRRPTPEEMQEATVTARRHLLNVSCLTGNEGLKFEVMRVV